MANLKYGLAWDKKYEIGCGHVDAQHYRMFELVSDLVSACMDGSATEKLRSTIDFLVEYTVKHFYDEESVQVQWSYPEYERHKKLHDDFKETVTGIVEKYNQNGSSEELSNDVNRVVVRWLIDHIQKEDKKIGDHIRSVTAVDG